MHYHFDSKTIMHPKEEQIEKKYEFFGKCNFGIYYLVEADDVKTLILPLKESYIGGIPKSHLLKQEEYKQFYILSNPNIEIEIGSQDLKDILMEHGWLLHRLTLIENEFIEHIGFGFNEEEEPELFICSLYSKRHNFLRSLILKN